MDDEQLIDRAKDVLRCRELTPECIAGEVSAALLTAAGNVYVGVSISAGCGVGFCAEHSAVAAMVTHGESQVQKLVAISSDGKFLPPCGRCREMLFQIDRANLDAEVILGSGRTVRLEALLPERWQEWWD
jgi:cytidine deaminase